MGVLLHQVLEPRGCARDSTADGFGRVYEFGEPHRCVVHRWIVHGFIAEFGVVGNRIFRSCRVRDAEGWKVDERCG